MRDPIGRPPATPRRSGRSTTSRCSGAPTRSTWWRGPGSSRRPGSSSTAVSTRPSWPSSGTADARGHVGRQRRDRARVRVPLALPGAIGLRRHRRELGLRRPGAAGQGRRPGPARRALDPGLGPRIPFGHRPHRRPQRDVHRAPPVRPDSSWSAWSAKSGASIASGSTWSSSSACSDGPELRARLEDRADRSLGRRQG